jgi:hypothetical protein
MSLAEKRHLLGGRGSHLQRGTSFSFPHGDSFIDAGRSPIFNSKVCVCVYYNSKVCVCI